MKKLDTFAGYHWTYSAVEQQLPRRWLPSPRWSSSRCDSHATTLSKTETVALFVLFSVAALEIRRGAENSSACSEVESRTPEAAVESGAAWVPDRVRRARLTTSEIQQPYLAAAAAAYARRSRSNLVSHRITLFKVATNSQGKWRAHPDSRRL